MADAYVDLAKLLKARDNVSRIGLRVGKLISISGDNIKIAMGNIMIDTDKDNLVIAARLRGINELAAGDRVIIGASDDNQLFFILDKVG